jgi:hypothetical protein
MPTGQSVILADHNAVILDLYDRDKMYEIGLDTDPILKQIDHETEWSGDHWEVPIQHGTNQSVSAGFVAGQGVRGQNLYSKFILDPAEYFGFVHFSRRFLKSAKGPNAPQYVDGMKAEWDGLFETLKLEKAAQGYRSFGCKGRFTTAVHPTRPTLVANNFGYVDEIRDAVLFHVGMIVQLSADDGSVGAVRAGTLEVAGVDLDTGMITFTGAINVGIAAAAAQDYLFRNGDFGQGYLGLPQWLPLVVSPMDNFGSVNRSVDRVRLAGHVLNIGTLSISEALRKLAAKIGTVGGTPDTGVLHVDRWTDLETEMESQGIRDFKETDAQWGFEVIKLRTPKGTVKIASSPVCDYNDGYMLQKNTWKYRSAGLFPEIFTDDGLNILREAAANSYEGRAGWIAQMACKAPGFNGRLNFRA